ncbi:MAG: hypothetical protein QXW62_06710 [Candidatus Methanomethylicaceae archaeon]
MFKSALHQLIEYSKEINDDRLLEATKLIGIYNYVFRFKSKFVASYLSIFVLKLLEALEIIIKKKLQEFKIRSGKPIRIKRFGKNKLIEVAFLSYISTKSLEDIFIDILKYINIDIYPSDLQIIKELFEKNGK